MPEIALMTYARVAHNANPGAMTGRPHDAGVDRFLLDHVAALQASAQRGDAPMAEFVDTAAKALFDSLMGGTDAEFYSAARSLAGRLVDRMDGRAAPGLLLCLRIVDGPKVSVAALKLEVVTPNAAVLEALDSGEEVLSAATNVLDAPGELQKGALLPDPRPGSVATVGDRLARDAAYFPQALGIRTTERTGESAAQLIDSVQRHAPAAAMPTAAALPGVQPGPVTRVLEELSQLVPGLTPEVRADVEADLLDRQRPVRDIQTAASVKTVIQGDGITVTGSATAMAKVTIERDPDGDGWRLVVPLTRQPRTTHRR